ncbi:MAG: DUF2520 domain-containing protein [Actinobacteria bacterium]|nr:DUF2520 domain-containing protein [Actinomycetota bacterium]
MSEHVGTPDTPVPRIAVVGRGRMGRALAAALAARTDIGVTEGPFGRGFDGTGFDLVLLAVPDAQIATAAAVVVQGPIVGHCAGALGLDVLGDRAALGLHPLMTVTRQGADFVGCAAAVAGTTPRAEQLARDLAVALGMHPFHVADADRGAYHAAASIASNFLVTLEDAAEQLLATTGNDRSVLVPLVRAAVENWAALGGRAAITGPIARGDDASVARQRAALASRTPELLALFDAMCAATRSLVVRDE